MRPKPPKRSALRKKIKSEYGSMIAFAYAVRVSDALVSKVVNGWVDVSEERKRTWADALSCDVNDIFQ